MQNANLAFCVLAYSFLMFSVDGRASAAESFNLETGDAWIETGGVDDHFSCSINGKLIAEGHFGLPQMSINLGPALRPGDNQLNCKVNDDNGGSCYSYEIRIKSGYRILKTLEASCCNNASCARSNPVLDDTTILKVR